MNSFWIYLAVMAIVTYLTRMLPLVLVKKKIRHRFICSFLYYVPYAVLSVITIPAIFYAVENRVSAVIGFLVALIISYFEKGLVVVASFSCLAVLFSELIIKGVL
jgi:branched-subunit amino acid transport protein